MMLPFDGSLQNGVRLLHNYALVDHMSKLCALTLPVPSYLKATLFFVVINGVVALLLLPSRRTIFCLRKTKDGIVPLAVDASAVVASSFHSSHYSSTDELLCMMHSNFGNCD